MTHSWPLTIQDAKKLAVALSIQNKSISSGIPKNLLYISVNAVTNPDIMWFTPACSKRHLFSESTNIPSDVYPVPPLIWFYRDNTLELYATDTNEPTEDSKVYKAPYFNVTNDVCLGEAVRFRKKLTDFKTFMEHFETLFWYSEFTHLSDDNCFDGNLNSFYLSKPIEFPLDKLVLIKKTKVKDLWKHSQ